MSKENLEEIQGYARKMLGMMEKNEPGDPVHVPTSKFRWLCDSIMNLEAMPPSQQPLTEAQQQVLDVIKKMVAEKVTPSMRKIASELGLSSQNTVQTHVTNLEAKGYIVRKGAQKLISVVAAEQ